MSCSKSYSLSQTSRSVLPEQFTFPATGESTFHSGSEQLKSWQCSWMCCQSNQTNCLALSDAIGPQSRRMCASGITSITIGLVLYVSGCVLKLPPVVVENPCGYWVWFALFQCVPCHPTLGPQAQEDAQHIPSHSDEYLWLSWFLHRIETRGPGGFPPPLCTRSSCHLLRGGLDVCHLLAVRLIYPSVPSSNLHCCGRRQQHPIWTFPSWTGPALPLHGLIII